MSNNICSSYNINGLLNSINSIDIHGVSLPNINMPNFKFPNTTASNFTLPDINTPSFPLPSMRMIHGYNIGVLPDFVMGKIDGLKLNNMFPKFECSIKGLDNTYGMDINFKQSNLELSKINCGDSTAKLNTPRVRNEMLKKAIKVGNCGKDSAEAMKQATDDLKVLGIKNPMVDSVLGAIVDDKLDVGTAATMLGAPDVTSKLTDVIAHSTKPLNQILKVGNEIGIKSNKDDIIKFTTKIADPKKIANFKHSPVLSLAGNASKDSANNNTSVPTGKQKLNTSQGLTLLHRASMAKAKNKNIFEKIKKYA